MKILKKIGKALLWTLVALLVLLLALPLWIGPAVKGVANSVVPGKVGADFRLNEFALNPYCGKLHVGAMTLANPPGFRKENCVELGAFDVKVDVSTVMSKKIRIENAELDGLLVVVASNGKNFRQIARNASGPEAPAEASPAVDVAADPAPETAASESPAGEETRVQIDRFVARNIVVKFGMIPVPVPTIELTGIGADRPEGASWTEVGLLVCASVMKSVGAISDFGRELLNSGADAAARTVDATADAAMNATTQTVHAATVAAAGAVEKTADAAARTIGATLGTATDAAGTTVDAAEKAVKGIAGEAIESIKGVKNLKLKNIFKR